VKKRPVTIKDIAERLNLSKSTVSRALTDAEDINSETKHCVLEMAKKLKYQPNSSALNLIKGKTNTLGIIIPSFTIPFYATAISGIENYAKVHGYNIIACQSNESYQQEEENINILLRSGVDGIALSLSKETKNFEHLIPLKELGIPVVLFNRVANTEEFSTVTANDYLGAKNAVSFLISRRKRSIAFIGGPQSLLLSKNREKGYRDALIEEGIAQNGKAIVASDFSIESGRKAAKKLLKAFPQMDAIFCICDEVALGVLEELKQQKISVPENIAVVGFTNELVSKYTSPALTTVGQPMFEIGQKTAEILIEHIKHFSVNFNPMHYVFDTKFVDRESV
jgi:DNA-binding LacI/PurR family transcriptional regulator